MTTFFDPAVPGVPQTITGPARPPISRADYQSDATPPAGAYQVHFHWCFPPDETEIDFLPHGQSFSLGPEFIPSPASSATFQELFRWRFRLNRLSLEISSDGGNRRKEIYGRNGSAPAPLVPPPTTRHGITRGVPARSPRPLCRTTREATLYSAARSCVLRRSRSGPRVLGG